MTAPSDGDLRGEYLANRAVPHMRQSQDSEPIDSYDKGRLIFLEPMVTQAYLKSKPDVTVPVKTPEHYSVPGWYPTNYTVRYDKKAKRYLVALGGLKAWK